MREGGPGLHEEGFQMSTRLARVSSTPLATLVCLIGLVAGCDSGTTTFREVPVEGLPVCDQTAGLNLLKNPIAIEIDHGKGTLKQNFIGVDRAPVVSLPEKDLTLKIRTGVCPETKPTSAPMFDVHCDAPAWSADTTELRLDVRSPGAKLSLKAPANAPCWR